MLTSFVSSYRRVLISIENNDISLRRSCYVIRRETKWFQTPTFSKSSQDSEQQWRHAFASRNRHLVRRRVCYAHVSCFNFMQLQSALEGSALVKLRSAYGCQHEFFAHDVLLTLSVEGLTRYARQLHRLACWSQECGKIFECNGKGLCKASIQWIYILGRVATILHSKGQDLDKYDLGYAFNSTSNRGEGPANAIEKIFRRLIQCDSPEGYREMQEQ